jgi:hypothetical protein
MSWTILAWVRSLGVPLTQATSALGAAPPRGPAPPLKPLKAEGVSYPRAQPWQRSPPSLKQPSPGSPYPLCPKWHCSCVHHLLLRSLEVPLYPWPFLFALLLIWPLGDPLPLPHATLNALGLQTSFLQSFSFTILTDFASGLLPDSFGLFILGDRACLARPSNISLRKVFSIKFTRARSTSLGSIPRVRRRLLWSPAVVRPIHRLLLDLAPPLPYIAAWALPCFS